MAAHKRILNVTFICVVFGIVSGGCSDDSGENTSPVERDGGEDDGGGESGSGGRGSRDGGGGSGRAGSGGDVDECADSDLNDCDPHATCTDTDDGYTCECDGPAYSGDGESCECADGYAEVDGECLAEDGTECDESDDCEHGHCVEGVCCASACDAPEVCQTAEGATCEDGSTCAYPAADEGDECDDDNVCTENDVCSEGLCVGDGSEIDPSTACADGDLCSPSGYHCEGNTRGDCVPTDPPDCSSYEDQCNAGACDPQVGCIAEPVADGTVCDDGDACSDGETCTAGTCGGGSDVVCDDENPCTDDSCNPVSGCTTTNNIAVCDDGNPCTLNDHCAGGLCQDTDPKDCSGQNNVCNLGICDPTDGSCDRMPRANTTVCNDGNACTSNDHCNNGTCTGSGDSCGPECASNPCHANATCNDPSAAPGYTCTCNPGYTGNGVTCTDINECANNPCGAGRGTCTQGAPGTYTCACNAGYTEVNGTCVCDMNGTFAVRVATDLSWTNVDGLDNGDATTYSWMLRRHEYDDEGHLTVETIQCGGTTPELCGAANVGFGTEAFAQYAPNHIWGGASMPEEVSEMDLTNPLPSQPFVTPNTASLLGVSLTNPLGAWPAANQNVGAGAGQTNGAIWVDHDGDGFPGVTTIAVPPGGVSDNNAGNDDPPLNYPATSAECGDPWAYFPGVEGLTIRRVRRFYVATRVISRFDGDFVSCDRAEGAVAGPNDGQLQSDIRVYGCVDNSPDSTCGSSLVDFYDDAPQTQEVEGATFVMRRVANNITCDQVRALTF